MVVLIRPHCGQPPRSRKTVKLLHAQKLIPEPTVKALGIGIFPWGSRFNIERFHSRTLQPLTDLGSDELRAVVTPNVLQQPAKAT